MAAHRLNHTQDVLTAVYGDRSPVGVAVKAGIYRDPPAATELVHYLGGDLHPGTPVLFALDDRLEPAHAYDDRPFDRLGRGGDLGKVARPIRYGSLRADPLSRIDCSVQRPGRDGEDPDRRARGYMSDIRLRPGADATADHLWRRIHWQTVAAEVSRADLKRVLVIASGSSEAIAEQIVGDLGSSAAGRLSEVRQHVPRPLAEEACHEAIAADADGLVAVGGGSSIGLAKAVAVRLGLSIVAVPVTYSGSEVSSVYGITDERKHTAKDPQALPMVVIYDPELGRALSSRVTAASGFNALAHAVEALYSPGRNPTSSLQAVEAIRLLAGALPVLVGRSDDIRRRAEALLGAYLAGSATATAGTALQHKLAHVLGGSARPDPCRVARRAPPPRHRIQPICVGRPVGRCGGQALGAPDTATGSVASRAPDRQPNELGRAGSGQGGA